MNVPQPEPVLRAEPEGAVLRLVLNRPVQRNALSDGLIGALQDALDAAARAPSVRAIVLAAEGPAFCAGHDLREMTAQRCGADRGREAFAGIFARCSRLMQSIVRHPRPVIAEVHGIATAAGCQLVASCDLAVASTQARFATPGVNIGLFCSTPMVALSRNVARKHAMEMLLTGEAIGAEDARRIGLVNRIVEPHALAGETMNLARLIAAKPAGTVKIGKEAFYRQLEMSLGDAYAYASEVMTMNMLDAAAEEGVGAFFDKRPAKWPE